MLLKLCEQHGPTFFLSEVAKLTLPMMTQAEEDDEGEESTDPLIL